MRGVQVGGVNYTDDLMAGAQLSYAVNVAAQRLDGAQLGFLNWTGSMHGAQLGVANIAEEHQGAQLGLFNQGGRGAGFQFGLVNVGKGGSGLQLGLINVATKPMKGGQVGLLNFADRTGAQVGLLGGTRQGGIHPQLWVSDVALFNAALRLDADYTYLLFWFAANALGKSRDFGDEDELLGFGLGLKLPLTGALRLEADYSAGAPIEGGDREFSLKIGRILLNWQVASKLALFGGPSINFLTHRDPEHFDSRPGLVSGSVEVSTRDDQQVLFWPGFALGAHLP
jgi:hypothetical protein